jgi:hypothetical protein
LNQPEVRRLQTERGFTGADCFGVPAKVDQCRLHVPQGRRRTGIEFTQALELGQCTLDPADLDFLVGDEGKDLRITRRGPEGKRRLRVRPLRIPVNHEVESRGRHVPGRTCRVERECALHRLP